MEPHKSSAFAENDLKLKPAIISYKIANRKAENRLKEEEDEYT